MSYQTLIRENLEKLFDLPFTVETRYSNNQPQTIILPEEKTNETLFTLHMEYRNGVRLRMWMEPRRYSMDMIRSMEHASAEKKKLFCDFQKAMQNRGAKVTFEINGIPCTPEDPDNWPAGWTRVNLTAEVFPITEHPDGSPDFEKCGTEWSQLMTGMILSLLDVVPVNTDQNPSGKEEGNCTQILTNRYERNRFNRMLCLEKYGYICQACGFDFEKTYGAVGHHFIHVHHLIPVSQMGEHYIVDPLTDLIPLCPNCHAMMHRYNPMLSLDEFKKTILR